MMKAHTVKVLPMIVTAMICGCTDENTDNAIGSAFSGKPQSELESKRPQQVFFSDSSSDRIVLSENWSASFRDKDSYTLEYLNTEIQERDTLRYAETTNKDLSAGWVFYGDSDNNVFCIGTPESVDFHAYSTMDPLEGKSERLNPEEVMENDTISDAFKTAYKTFLDRQTESFEPK